MTERTLGTSGLTTPPLILGGNVFGWTADRRTSFAILDAFVAGGGRLVDTADSYASWVPGNSGGESETIIGEWLSARGRRDDVLIATKVGAEVFGGRGLSPARITASVEGSLKRLRTDSIDLYFEHYDDPETPLDATLDGFDSLVRAGKVRAIGASNYSVERLRQALDTSAARTLASYTVLQSEYNLSSGRSSKARCRSCASSAASQSSPTTRSPRGFCRARTAAAPTPRTGRAAQPSAGT